MFQNVKMIQYLVLSVLITILNGDGHISAVSSSSTKTSAKHNQGTALPRIRHKSFAFNHIDKDSDEAQDDHEDPVAQYSRSSSSGSKSKSILEKLVREPQLGNVNHSLQYKEQQQLLHFLKLLLHLSYIVGHWLVVTTKLAELLSSTYKI